MVNVYRYYHEKLFKLINFFPEKEKALEIARIEKIKGKKYRIVKMRNRNHQNIFALFISE